HRHNRAPCPKFTRVPGPRWKVTAIYPAPGKDHVSGIVDHGGDALLYPDFQAVLPITNQQDGRCHPTAVKSRGIGVINRINLSWVKMLSSMQILICIAPSPYTVRLPSPKLRLLGSLYPQRCGK